MTTGTIAAPDATPSSPAPQENADAGSKVAAPGEKPQPTPEVKPEPPQPKDYSWAIKKYAGEVNPDSFDVEDYAKKTSKAYVELEKRLGKKGALAPETVDEYDYKPKYELSQTFKEKAMKEGKLSKEQFQWVAQQYESLVDQATSTPESTEKVLKEMWGDNYDTNGKLAAKAFETFVPSHISIEQVGNNPLILDILANIGRELGEDKALHTKSVRQPSMTDKELEEFRNSPDYWTTEGQKKAAEYYKRKHGEK